MSLSLSLKYHGSDSNTFLPLFCYTKIDSYQVVGIGLRRLSGVIYCFRLKIPVTVMRVTYD